MFATTDFPKVILNVKLPIQLKDFREHHNENNNSKQLVIESTMC